MKLTRRTVLAASAATLGSSLAAPAVKASPDWPTKAPIKLIARFPPGGTADTISRILPPSFLRRSAPRSWWKTSPAPAARPAPTSPPRRFDGYTLVISHASPLGIAPRVYPKLPYSVVTDFTHVTLIGHTPTS